MSGVGGGLESPEIPARLNAVCADGLHEDGAQVGTARIHRRAKEEYSKSLDFDSVAKPWCLSAQ